MVLDLRAKLDANGYYDDFEVERVAKIETDPSATQARLSSAMAPVADRLLKRYRAAQLARADALGSGDEPVAQAQKDIMDALQLFKGDMGAYVRLYAFLSQMIDYGNTDIEKRFIFYKRLIPLLEFGRERETVDLSKVVLTHHTLRSAGRQPMNLRDDGKGDYRLPPMDAMGTGDVQEKERALLREIIEKVNGLFAGQLTDGDQLQYVNGALREKMLENPTLIEQSASNSKEQFANSPDLREALTHAIMDALEAHTMMSSQALGSERIREGLLDILLGPAQLYEGLRAQATGADAASRDPG
ncbi:hypothetical protein [Metallibacterium scheffleri]|uniref:hypothetical protein n=1 Tax=Metallibacterium scheffleri TaxID=993689 RepID=UPI0026EFB706|nr:hypothetical protein [Metallibacterium scheffleri]